MDDAKDAGAEIQGSHSTNKTVLIVDDTEEGGAAIEQACTELPGFDTRVVSSALEAVRLLDDGDHSICAVVTDIRMPRMDGFELIEFIRAHLRHAAMPIIVVTADTDPRTPRRASRLGASAYFAKPFSPRAIRRTLEELIHAK